MSQERTLRDVLSELHEALESTPDLEGGLREELRSAAQEINDALDATDDTPLGQLRNRLQEALERFEEQHAQLTGVVGRVADALSDLGI